MGKFMMNGNLKCSVCSLNSLNLRWNFSIKMGQHTLEDLHRKYLCVHIYIYMRNTVTQICTHLHGS